MNEQSCSDECNVEQLTSVCASKPSRRAVRKSLAAPHEGASVKRLTSIRVIFFFLLARCTALCQELPSSVWKSLPNAPSSIQPQPQAEGFHTFVINSARVPRGAGYPGLQPSLTAHYQAVFISKKSSAYAPSTSGSFMGRVSYAASSIFIARNRSGKDRLSSSRVLCLSVEQAQPWVSARELPTELIVPLRHR